MKKCFLFIALFIIVPRFLFAACGGTTTVDGNNYTAYDASQECVALAVSDAESGGYGKTVIIPACAAGDCSWTSGVNITKNMIIQGAGVGEGGTYLTNGVMGATSSVYKAFFKFTPDETARNNINALDDTGIFEVKDIHFYKAASRESYTYGIWVTNSNTPVIKRVRVHGCSFTNIHRAFYVWGYVHALFDNNTLTNANVSYPENTDSGNPDGWVTNDLRSIGTSEALYIEDNTIAFTGMAAGSANVTGAHSKGASVVLRYNTVTSDAGQLAFETHCPASQFTEVYGNDYSGFTSSQSPQLRSGKGIVFFNKTDAAVRLRQEYHDQYWINIAGVQLSNVCATTSYFPYKGSWASGQEYTAGDVYYYNTGSCSARDCRFVVLQNHTSASGNAPPAAEYWGIAEDNLASVTGYIGYGGTSPQICNDSIDSGDDCMCYKVNHSYFWNNRNNAGTLLNAAKGDESYDDSMQADVGLTNTGVDGAPNPEIAANREYFNYTATFDGTAGMGCGTVAQMNAITPTLANAGFWATDQNNCGSISADNIGVDPTTPISGTLYRWNGSAWVAYYTPYAYPHPLRNETSQQTLTLTVGGSGACTVTSFPAGISSTSSTTYDFEQNTEVTMTVSATSPNYFSGWSGTGGCTGTGSCVMTMSAAKAATATCSRYGVGTIGAGGQITFGAGGSMTLQ